MNTFYLFIVIANKTFADLITHIKNLVITENRFYIKLSSVLQTGTLQYCGPTEFAGGVWAGIELDEPVGKNDGSIGGISYFNCPPNYGGFTFIFVNRFNSPK